MIDGSSMAGIPARRILSLRSLLTHAILFQNLWSLSVNGQSLQNVTLDDNDPRISYLPTAWNTSTPTSLNYGGSHKLAENPIARAELKFTGTAVYFMSPLWPYVVNTALSLDGAPPMLVDLQDHTGTDDGSGRETVASAVVWSRANLPNTQHTLTISVGAGQPYAIVDGIILTELPSTSSSTTASITTGSPSSSSALSSQSSAAVNASSKELSSGAIAGIAVGSSLGLVALVGIIFVLLSRRQQKKREQKQQEKLHRSNIPSFYDDPTPNSAYSGGMGVGADPRGGTVYDPAGWRSQDSPTGPVFDSSTLYTSNTGTNSPPAGGTFYDPAGYRHSTVTSNSYAPVPTHAGSDQLSYADGPSLRGISSQDTLGSGRGPHIPGGYISSAPINPETRAPNRFNPPQSAYAATLSTLSNVTQKSASSGTTIPPPVPKKVGSSSTPAARLYASGLPPSRANVSGSTQDGSSHSKKPPSSDEKKGGFKTVNEYDDAPPTYQG